MNRRLLLTLITLLVVFSFISTCIIAQNTFSYSSLKDDEAAKKALVDATEKRYETDVASLNGSNKKYIAEVYKDRFQYIEKLYADSSVITNTQQQQYLQSILSEIVNNNPALKNMDVRVLFSRSYWPNAFCAGEGTILFNIGLFTRLQNESQAAFIICHELSHQYLNHSNKYIESYVNTVYSDTFQRRLRKIKNTEYGKAQLLEQTVTGISFSSHRHGREHEAQADSMALEFLKNTHYNVNSAVTCLALLDSVDNDKYNISPKPDSFFNNVSYPFQPAWTKQESNFFTALAASTVEENKGKEDSLKTHPDCLLRVKNLQPKTVQYINASGKDFIVDDSVAFHQLQQTFDFEIVNYNYLSKNLSRSLYYSLQMLQSYPENAYLVTNIGNCFNKMYEAQKNHVLGKIIEAPSPQAEKKYNDFLLFLQRLRLTDIASVNYYFLKSYYSKLSSDAAFKNTFQKSSQLFNN